MMPKGGPAFNFHLKKEDIFFVSLLFLLKVPTNTKRYIRISSWELQGQKLHQCWE